MKTLPKEPEPQPAWPLIENESQCTVVRTEITPITESEEPDTEPRQIWDTKISFFWNHFIEITGLREPNDPTKLLQYLEDEVCAINFNNQTRRGSNRTRGIFIKEEDLCFVSTVNFGYLAYSREKRSHRTELSIYNAPVRDSETDLVDIIIIREGNNMCVYHRVKSDKSTVLSINGVVKISNLD
jgi:hypothetical protein